jgi:hypothetical protein
MRVNTNPPPPPHTHTHTHTHTHAHAHTALPFDNRLVLAWNSFRIVTSLFIMQRLRRLWWVLPPPPPLQVVLRPERLWESSDLKRPPFCKLDQLVTYSECAQNTFNLKCGRTRSLWDLWWTVWQCNKFSVRVSALPHSLILRWYSALVTIGYSGIWWCVDG